MPSGPKKRKAAAAAYKRKKQGSPDRDSTSDSLHIADEDGSNFDKHRQWSKRLLSLDLKEEEEGSRQASDLTFHKTEEWVRISDFDVGTPPSSTTAYYAATVPEEDRVGKFRDDGCDKLGADWETIDPRPDAAVGITSLSPTDFFLEVDHQGAADEPSSSPSSSSSSSPGRRFSLPSRSQGLVDQEDDDDDDADSEHSSEPPQDSSEETHLSTQERSSSITIVEIASSQGEQDDDDEEEEDHGSFLEVEYPEEQGRDQDQASSVVDVSSIAEQEVEDQYYYCYYSSSIVDVVSLDEDRESSDDQDSSSSSVVLVVAANAADDEEVDNNHAFLFRESYMSEEPDDEAYVNSTLAAASVATSLSDDNQAMAIGVAGTGSCLREDEQSSSSTARTAEQFRTVSELQEAVGGNRDVAPLEHWEEENNSGVPELPEMHVLEELLDTSDSKELAHLGQQEEEIFRTEEKVCIEKQRIAEPQMEHMSAVLDAANDLSEPSLNWREVLRLQPVQAPLDKDRPHSQDAALHYNAESNHSWNAAEECQASEQSPNDAAVECGEQESAMREAATSTIDHGANSEALLAENPQPDEIPAEKEEEEEEAPAVMSPKADDGTEAIAVPTEKEDNVVQIRSSPSGVLQRSLAEQPNKCTAIVSFFGKGFSIGGPGGPPTYLLQFIPLKKAEEHNRALEPWDEARDLAGCCEPVQWLFDQWFAGHGN